MKRTVEKRLGGLIELRDYDVQKAIAENDKIEVTYQKEVMTLSPEELVSKKLMTSRAMQSKFSTKEYRLLGYRWKSDELDY
jgi:hypothetical protein